MLTRKNISLLPIILAAIFCLPALCGAQNQPATPVPTRGPEDFSYQTKNFSLSLQDQNLPVDQNILVTWQAPLQISNDSSITIAFDLTNNLNGFLGLPTPSQPNYILYHYRVDKIYSYIEKLTEPFNKEAKEPKFVTKDNRVTDFDPGQTGQELETYQSAFNVAAALENGQSQATLTISQTTPQKQLSEINPYGIKELVAQGVSNFSGSPKNRRFNIAVGVEKMKGVLVAPNATFSFNDNLGPVDGEHGFLPELVIKGKEGTIPEFGGGLCQVSTTTFRAAMNAGLPITERRNHAYAVQYYSPQGTDATIYPGSSDLKFTNNTPGYLLVWPYQKDSNNLVFDFYGIKDSRQVTLDKPDVYDKKPDGSMKATWTRHITMNGETKTDVFKSTYQSPALFHHEQSFTLGPEFYVGPAPKKTP